MFKWMSLIYNLVNRMDQMSQAIDDLNAAVTNIQNAVAAAVTDIQSLTQQIATALAANDSASIEAAVTKLNDTAATLNAAVTPPAPAPAAPTA